MMSSSKKVLEKIECRQFRPNGGRPACKTRKSREFLAPIPQPPVNFCFVMFYNNGTKYKPVAEIVKAILRKTLTISRNS